MSDAPDSPAAPNAPRWRALDRHERRVAGVLAEKAKTTPENYPLSLNALINGSNQKSNRFPQMQLDESQATAALDSLRHAGAVSLIQGDGRVEKFRHLLYDWLGVDKAELAVMTELLLRGAQTLGELRGRAARMEPIADVAALQPIVDGLIQKNLVIRLTPSGRGAVVTHNLYQPQELAKLRAEHSGGAPSGDDEGAAPPSRAAVPAPARMPASAPAAPAAPAESARGDAAFDELREQLAGLRREFAEFRSESEASLHDLRRDLDDLKHQLG